MPLLHSRSLGSVSGLLDPPLSQPRRSATPDKPLPLTPQPSMSTASLSIGAEPSEDDDATLLPPTDVTDSPRTSNMTRREHALIELLKSERTYATDLTYLRDLHMPLASGQMSSFSANPATPPGSSASSSRTLSTASDASAASYLPNGQPPMTKEDVKIVFSNVSELARFSEDFARELEWALGELVEGGEGDDYVGKLFLRVIPQLEPLYRTYITKQATGLEHFNSLPRTPAFNAYLAQTQALAHAYSGAWDLPSLLIKPVQRLTKYPLLLHAIISETPDSHPDKPNLIEAHARMEEVARGVNEGRRRREVVRDVLTSAAVISTPQKVGETVKAKKKSTLSVGVAASVSLGRMKSLRSAALKAKEGAEANAEAEAVKAMGEQLKSYEPFMEQLARDSLKWADSVKVLMGALDQWAHTFGRVIWMGPDDVPSEAFDAFLQVIRDQLLPICDETKDVLRERLLPLLTGLVDTMVAPLRLLEAMHTLEPLHYGLLNLNVAKSRPPPQLLEASQSYVALRAQLFAELPTYLALIDKGMAACILKFAHIQRRFYSNVRERWSELWDALKVDEEANQGASETLRVWWGRFAEVEVQIQDLNIVRPLEKKTTPDKQRTRPSKPRLSEPEATRSVVVSSVLAALDPLSISHPQPSTLDPSLPISPGPVSAKTRSVHSTHSMESEYRAMAARKSEESLHSKKSSKSAKSRRPSSSRTRPVVEEALPSFAGFGVPGLAALAPASTKPSYSRTKSSPMPQQLNKSQSSTKYLDVDDDIALNSSNPSLHSLPATIEDDGGRGRPSRKPSFRRRLTDSFRTSANNVTNDTRHRRSPSLPNNYQSPSPSPNKPTFGPRPAISTRSRGSGGQIPSLYECRVIHSCEPPEGVEYRDLPFFTLVVDDVYDILQEAGHPSTHRDLPLYVDDGEDCLLLARNQAGEVGWVLASFLVPVD
ncbi:hypothetical protein BD309DRAFT_972704 [Dichomitus squalens]|uniref:Uncharacterized protein n=1 Tax=Dichomitus squalens TaxID=114155 RepID=A0A4Q9NFW7_9APHY|nr:hypothetical protein BD309DRAFT_972704 [Dichomitus squalens]TBU55885.1 hypothetical protein BD310DRAFT_950501 [Dichomitus squalens]